MQKYRSRDFDLDSVSGLIDYAKKNPGQVRYGTGGPASYPHYDMAYFAKRAGDLDLIAVLNKAGVRGVINDVLTGSTQVAFLNVASAAPQVKAGSFRALAVVNHARVVDFPDLPTMQEVGFPGVGTMRGRPCSPAPAPRMRYCK
jgi:tripartite-type tricarboxylate transporter receptor subunit TctC